MPYCNLVPTKTLPAASDAYEEILSKLNMGADVSITDPTIQATALSKEDRYIGHYTIGSRILYELEGEIVFHGVYNILARREIYRLHKFMIYEPMMTFKMEFTDKELIDFENTISIFNAKINKLDVYGILNYCTHFYIHLEKINYRGYKNTRRI